MCSVYINKVTKNLESRSAARKWNKMKTNFCVCISRSLLPSSLILHSTRVIKTTSSHMRRIRRRRRKARANKRKMEWEEDKFLQLKKSDRRVGHSRALQVPKNNKTHKMWVVTLTEFTVISKSQTHARNAQKVLDEFSLLRDLQCCLMHTTCASTSKHRLTSDNSSHPHMRSSSSSFLMYASLSPLGMF